MNLLTAYEDIKAALDEIPEFSTVHGVSKHPEIWIDQAARGDTSVVFPLISLSFESETPGYVDGGQLWSIPSRPLADLSIHLVLTSSTDSLEYEMIRLIQKIENKIVELTLKNASDKFLCAIRDIATVGALNGSWKWAIITVQLGGHKS